MIWPLFLVLIGNCCEAKNKQGYWLYGRIIHQREVYMVLNNKERVLKEVHETVSNILEQDFPNLFYAP